MNNASGNNRQWLRLDLSAVIQIVGLILTLLTLYMGVINRLAAMETKVDAMWYWFSRRLEIDGRNPAP